MARKNKGLVKRERGYVHMEGKEVNLDTGEFKDVSYDVDGKFATKMGAWNKLKREHPTFIPNRFVNHRTVYAIPEADFWKIAKPLKNDKGEDIDRIVEFTETEPKSKVEEK